MSTKCTVTHGENYHLYEECFDFDGLYLNIQGADIWYEIVPNSATLKIPNHILKDILNNSDKIKEYLENDGKV
jgi:hypothetical protein